MSSTFHLPYTVAETITPGDASTHNYVAFVAAAAGNVRVLDFYGTDTTIGVAAGVIIPLKIRRVFSTSTTATGIVGFN
jgi:hypothetical protein